MTTRITVGLDISYTNTGVATFKDGVFQKDLSFTISTKPIDGNDVQRSASIGKRIVKHLNELVWQLGSGVRNDSEVEIFIEDYAYARLTNREKMGEITGIVKFILLENGHEYETLPISTIRKTVTGKGNSKKDQVMYSLLKRHNLDITQNDIADAAAVALTGDFVSKARANKSEMDTWLLDVRTAIQSYLKANQPKVVEQK